MDPEREKFLLDKAQADLAAFEEIYDDYFPKIYAYVRYRVTNLQDVEDLTAAIFLRTAERLGEFQWRGDGSFAAWIFRIAQSILVDFYRKKGSPLEPAFAVNTNELSSDSHHPDDITLRNEKSAVLRYLISTLSPRRQEVLTLKFYGGLRNNEIAQILELDERTVASHLCRGLEDLH
ncbi:MAG TPA: sigma-70 family RNA polymerase sigma factor, partial [Anaerolineales bacterium]|nr:sigma-70 family RNA polymerase sigma factor [Anaerolineales bacterium]